MTTPEITLSRGAPSAASARRSQKRIVAYPCPAFAAVIYPVLRPLIPEGTGRRVVLLPGEAFADSPCPAGLDEFISLKAIRPDRRPQHEGLRPK